jgi:transposase
MSETTTVVNERIDDIPVLLAQMERMHVAKLLDEQIRPHGNWQGLSPGQVAVVWLAFILSESNHRLSHVEGWAERRLQTLQALVGDRFRALDVSDDRLASLLDELADDDVWDDFEVSLGQQTIRAYELPRERVRLDATTSYSYRAVDKDGLFQFGHSKDHRPDLPQLKINLSALDPLGLPLTTTIVAGTSADDPLYLPEIRRVQQVVGRRGVLYIGDVKMAALSTRATIGAHGDYYLCPLTARQVTVADLDALLDRREREGIGMERVEGAADTEGTPKCLAEGFEVKVELSAEVDDGSRAHWRERRLVVKSVAYERAQRKALDERLKATRQALLALAQRGKGTPVLTLEQARSRAQTLITEAGLDGVMHARLQLETRQRQVRGYGGKPDRIEQTSTLEIEVDLDDAALERVRRRLGWRVYATNAWPEQVGLEQAVLAYRASHRIEHNFARLKGKPLSLQPMYLTSEDRIKGLVRLLSIGLRVLTLVEFVARRALAEHKDPLEGLYAGNPKRATMRPTTELLLRAFKEVTLTVMTRGPLRVVHVSPLSVVQQRILRLLGMPEDSFDRLHSQISDSSFRMSET